MNKEQFLRELEALLSSLNQEDREDAIQYYENYFDEAGKEREQEIIQELGSPEKVAKTIIDGINGHFDNNINSSNEGFRNESYEDVFEVKKTRGQGIEDLINRWKELCQRDRIMLAVLLVISLIPIRGFLTSFSSLTKTALIIAMIGGAIFLGSWIVAFVLVVTGLAVLVYGFVSVPALPATACIYIGIGLILLSLSTVFEHMGKWFVTSLFPWVVEKLSDLFNRRGETQ